MSELKKSKILSGTALALYLLTLTWLVLFKFSFNISKVIHYQHRSLNLVPFAAPSIVNGRTNYGEMIFNCIFFIPFGLLLNVNLKNIGFLRKLFLILFFSLTAEFIQYLFEIGATDITDVITNTFGGFLGLIVYDLSNKYIDGGKLDKIINSIGIVLFVLFIAIHINHFVHRIAR